MNSLSNKNGHIAHLYPSFSGLGASVCPHLRVKGSIFIPLSNRFLTQISESRREQNGIAVPFCLTSNIAANTRLEYNIKARQSNEINGLLSYACRPRYFQLSRAIPCPFQLSPVRTVKFSSTRAKDRRSTIMHKCISA